MSETRRLLLEFETDEVGKLAKKDARIRQELVQAFSDSSEIVRERALIAAVELGDPRVVTDAVKALGDEEEDVRISAAQLVAWFGQPRTVPDLLKGLKDSNTWVRSHCASGLSKILHGPIWARVPAKDVDLLLSGLPGMSDQQIEQYMIGLKVDSEMVDRFIQWKEADFNVEIDMTKMVEELEAKPIVLAEESKPVEHRPPKAVPAPRGSGLSPGVEDILSELPEDIRSTLPPEDLKRLNATTARELVDSLKSSFPAAAVEAAKKKPVKVRRVKRVRKVRKGQTREELIAGLPDEVKDSVTPEILDSLSTDELEALVGASAEEHEAEPEAGEEAPPKTPTTKPVSGRPAATEAKTGRSDPRWEEYSSQYGQAKADLLVMVPPEMIQGLPAEQIREMDLETLKGLIDALKPRE
jgi:hypothetical protein